MVGVHGTIPDTYRDFPFCLFSLLYVFMLDGTSRQPRVTYFEKVGSLGTRRGVDDEGRASCSATGNGVNMF